MVGKSSAWQTWDTEPQTQDLVGLGVNPISMRHWKLFPGDDFTGEEYEFAHEFFGKFIPPNFLPFVGLTSPSMITVLVEIVRPNANVREYHRDTLRSYVHEALMTLESRWKVVSEAYTDISLMCKPPLF
jgi:hypothetical protein